MLSFVQCLATLLIATVSVAASFSQTGQTLTVNGINYLAAPNVVSIISLTDEQKSAASRGSDQALVPLTVLGDSSNKFTTSVFSSLVSNYTSTDDVFSKGFLESKFLPTPAEM